MHTADRFRQYFSAKTACEREVFFKSFPKETQTLGIHIRSIHFYKLEEILFHTILWHCSFKQNI